jgi:hypothetical protein
MTLWNFARFWLKEKILRTFVALAKGAEIYYINTWKTRVVNDYESSKWLRALFLSAAIN